ncbi:hypothetical protein HYS50_03595 [Candidatus Woesearchaeota archaeon]|nr:hypothetical protein [Candidatus Woesearchaeota archaeon]
MKKRGLLLILGLFLLVLPFPSSAAITIEGPEQTTFNFGDQLSITGTIIETADMDGYLKFELDCGEKEILATKAFSLKANVQKTLAETFTVPQSITGSCRLHVFFESNGEIKDELNSATFSVTSTLNAPITLNKESVQLGDSVTLAGTITRMDGKPIEGVAKVIFRQGRNIIVQDTVKISKGKFSYTYETEDNPAGAYEIEIEITDINNNKQIVIFDRFIILGNIGLTITLNDNEFLPGEKVKIDGTAKTGDSRITKGTAYITLDEKRDEATILLGILKHTIMLPEDIKTGEHTLTIDVEDSYGNKETQRFVIIITAVPTRMEIVMNQESFMPEQQVVIKPTLVDQGNDIIATDITIEVYDAEKDVVFTDTIKSTEQTAFTFPRTAAPGLWKVKAAAMDVDAFMSFKVEEFKVLDITQEGSTIVFANTGNIPIKERVTITMTEKNNPEYSKTKQKKVSLGVGASKAYDLAYMVKKGIYTVQVGDKSFDNVEILKRRWNIMPYLAGVLGIIIIYMLITLFVKQKLRRKPHHPEKQVFSQPKTRHYEQPIKRHRSQEYYEEKLKRDLTERLEAKRGRLSFKVKKQKDDYIMELPKKRERTTAQESPYRTTQESNEFLSNTEEFSDPWKTQEEQPKKEEKPKKGGLFGMFD